MRHLFQKAKSPQAETPTPADAPPDPLIVDEMVDAAPVVTVTDDGVPYEAIDAITIVNRATDVIDARRRELHLQGRSFSHVSEAADGAWIYRHDT